jgi:hypothetical protein
MTQDELDKIKKCVQKVQAGEDCWHCLPSPSPYELILMLIEVIEAQAKRDAA